MKHLVFLCACIFSSFAYSMEKSQASSCVADVFIGFMNTIKTSYPDIPINTKVWEAHADTLRKLQLTDDETARALSEMKKIQQNPWALQVIDDNDVKFSKKQRRIN
jgi:hypothetical protein